MTRGGPAAAPRTASAAIAALSAALLCAACTVEPIPHSPEPIASAMEFGQSRVRGGDNGLELVQWSVPATPAHVAEVLERHGLQDAVDPAMRERLARNGLHLCLVPVADLPATLANWEARLEDRGEQVVDGKKVRVLAFPYAPGLVVETALDPTSGRIVRSRGYSTGADKVEFITTYEDYRLVDGVLVAFREVNWANGRNTGETVVEQAGFPAALPAEMWRP